MLRKYRELFGGQSENAGRLIQVKAKMVHPPLGTIREGGAPRRTKIK
jgi:hypothetical protein